MQVKLKSKLDMNVERITMQKSKIWDSVSVVKIVTSKVVSKS